MSVRLKTARLVPSLVTSFYERDATHKDDHEAHTEEEDDDEDGQRRRRRICRHVFTKGKNKGLKCKTKVKTGEGNYCSQHRKLHRRAKHATKAATRPRTKVKRNNTAIESEHHSPNKRHKPDQPQLEVASMMNDASPVHSPDEQKTMSLQETIASQRERMRIASDVGRQGFLRFLRDNPGHPADKPWLVFEGDRLLNSGATFDEAMKGQPFCVYIGHMIDDAPDSDAEPMYTITSLSQTAKEPFAYVDVTIMDKYDTPAYRTQEQFTYFQYPRPIPIECMVDTGAKYLNITQEDADALFLIGHQPRRFRLADASEVTLQTNHVRVRFDQKTFHDPTRVAISSVRLLGRNVLRKTRMSWEGDKPCEITVLDSA
jgi:predicted aspartyl protease